MTRSPRMSWMRASMRAVTAGVVERVFAMVNEKCRYCAARAALAAFFSGAARRVGASSQRVWCVMNTIVRTSVCRLLRRLVTPKHPRHVRFCLTVGYRAARIVARARIKASIAQCGQSRNTVVRMEKPHVRQLDTRFRASRPLNDRHPGVSEPQARTRTGTHRADRCRAAENQGRRRSAGRGIERVAIDDGITGMGIFGQYPQRHHEPR